MQRDGCRWFLSITNGNSITHYLTTERSVRHYGSQWKHKHKQMHWVRFSTHSSIRGLYAQCKMADVRCLFIVWEIKWKMLSCRDLSFSHLDTLLGCFCLLRDICAVWYYLVTVTSAVFTLIWNQPHGSVVSHSRVSESFHERVILRWFLFIHVCLS